MKQRITIEQIKELTDAQKKKLCEWWKPVDGDWFYGTYGGGGHFKEDLGEWMLSPYEVDSGYYGASLNNGKGAMPDDNALPLLTIGQMLGFLHDTLGDINTESQKGGGSVVASNTIRDGEYGTKLFSDSELCDALWKVVKEALQ